MFRCDSTVACIRGEESSEYDLISRRGSIGLDRSSYPRAKYAPLVFRDGVIAQKEAHKQGEEACY